MHIVAFDRSFADEESSASELVRAIDRNQLLCFLIVGNASCIICSLHHAARFTQANLLTGAVNLSMRTLYASAATAYAVLIAYLATVLTAMLLLHRYGVSFSTLFRSKSLSTDSPAADAKQR